MAKIGITVSAEGYVGNLILIWKEAQNVAVEIGRSAAMPIPVNLVYPIIDIRPVVHSIEFWRSTNGVSLDQLLKVWEIDASLYDESIVETFYYTVNGPAVDADGNPTYNPSDYNLDGDGNPTIPNKALRDPRLKDEVYKVEQQGTGYLRPLAQWVDRSDAGGGFDLVGDGVQFFHQEEFAVTIERKEQRQEATISVSDYLDVHEVQGDVNGNIDFAPTFFKKLNFAKFLVDTGTINFPPFSSITNTKALFSTYGGAQKYLRLKFSTGDFITLNGQNLNEVFLGREELLELAWKGGKCYVLTDGTGYHATGRRINGDRLGLNTVYRDGTLYTRAQHPRLYEWILTLPASQVVTMGQWLTQASVDPLSVAQVLRFPWKGFFAIDTATKTFRVPDSRKKFERAIDFEVVNGLLDVTEDESRFTQGPGSYEHDQAFARVKVWTAGPGQPAGANGTGTDSTGYGYQPLSPTKPGAGIMQTRWGEVPGGVDETHPQNEGVLPLISV